MDCEDLGGIIVCGNFAEIMPEKPKDFDYTTTGKWMEDYPYDIRECIGGTIYSCKKIEVNYAPYYGWDNYHNQNCNLMRKIRINPQLTNLWAYDHLPAFAFSDKAVPAATHVPMYIKQVKHTQSIKVRLPGLNINQLSLF